MRSKIANSLEDIEKHHLNQWDYISSLYDLSEEFIDEYSDKVVWDSITRNRVFSESFIDKYKYKVNWYHILLYNNLSVEFIDTNLDLIVKYSHNDYKLWKVISQYQKLSEEFIEKYSDDVYWSVISDHQVLSESFIEKQHDKVNWNNISYAQILSEDFIWKHKDKLDWYFITKNQLLSESFMEKCTDYVSWYSIASSQILSESFIVKHSDKLLWSDICTCQPLSESFIENHIDEICWDSITKHQNLSEEFIEKHQDKVDIEIYNKSHRVMTTEERLSDMESYAKKYGLEFDGKYLYAYREHDKFGRGVWNGVTRYEVGKYYRDWHLDMDIDNDMSFGLGIYPKGNIRVKVSVNDWGLWLKTDCGKCRVWGFEVLEQN